MVGSFQTFHIDQPFTAKFYIQAILREVVRVCGSVADLNP